MEAEAPPPCESRLNERDSAEKVVKRGVKKWWELSSGHFSCTGAPHAARRGTLRPDRGHGGHARSSPAQGVCDGGPGSRRAPGGRVAE